jgi:hypothetical protein
MDEQHVRPLALDGNMHVDAVDAIFLAFECNVCIHSSASQAAFLVHYARLA